MATKNPLPALAQLQTALTKCYSKISEVLTTATAAIAEVSNAKADKNHTHNYAGSGSAGGSANSAVKLDTATAGSATQPVYFTGGKPTACTYTLGKSVPSNAVFTDTNTWRGCQNNLTSTATDQSLSAAMGKKLQDEKAAKVDPKTLTIPATGWGTDTSVSGYTKYVDVSISGLTASDTVCVIIADASASVADAACLCGECTSSAGKLRIRAKTVPTAAMTATYYIVR